VVSWSDGCAWIANLPVGSMSRSGLMGSWLNVISFGDIFRATTLEDNR
jgi:hypothetical protein